MEIVELTLDETGVRQAPVTGLVSHRLTGSGRAPGFAVAVMAALAPKFVVATANEPIPPVMWTIPSFRMVAATARRSRPVLRRPSITWCRARG